MLGRIEEAFDQRAASEARLRQFVADASHELRTPVATIRGYAELYRTGALDDADELDDAMRRTEQEAVRMGTLVDDLLHLARLDQGRPLERAPVDLGQLVEDAVRDARAVEPDRDDHRDDRRAPVTVLGDAPRLHQVVANLRGQRARARAGRADRGAGAPRTGPDAVIEVRDEGPGMSEADAARAFERFYRADASRSRHHGGSGLGPVDRRRHRAGPRRHRPSITSAPGAGTTVASRAARCERRSWRDAGRQPLMLSVSVVGHLLHLVEPRLQPALERRLLRRRQLAPALEVERLAGAEQRAWPRARRARRPPRRRRGRPASWRAG